MPAYIIKAINPIINVLLLINFSNIHNVTWQLISIPEIIVAPFGKAKFTACPKVVVNAPKSVAI